MMYDEFFGIEDNEDTVSINGWIAEVLGRMPEAGDSFKYENLEVEILKTESHRVSLIKVVIKNDENQD